MSFVLSLLAVLVWRGLVIFALLMLTGGTMYFGQL